MLYDMGVYVQCDICKREAVMMWNDEKKGFDITPLWPFMINNKTKNLNVVVCSEICKIIFEHKGAG